MYASSWIGYDSVVNIQITMWMAQKSAFLAVSLCFWCSGIQFDANGNIPWNSIMCVQHAVFRNSINYSSIRYLLIGHLLLCNSPNASNNNEMIPQARAHTDDIIFKLLLLFSSGKRFSFTWPIANTVSNMAATSHYNLLPAFMLFHWHLYILYMYI